MSAADFLNGSIVVLEGLPHSFTTSALEVLTSTLPQNMVPLIWGVCTERLMGWVVFRHSAHSAQAVARWNGLRCDGHVIEAWSSTEHPKRSVGLPEPTAEGPATVPPAYGHLFPAQPKVAAQHKHVAQVSPDHVGATKAPRLAGNAPPLVTPHYPFAAMAIHWLVELMASYSEEVTPSVVDCLMNVAVVTADVYLTHAVISVCARLVSVQLGVGSRCVEKVGTVERTSFELRCLLFESMAALSSRWDGVSKDAFPRVIEARMDELECTASRFSSLQIVVVEETTRVRQLCRQSTASFHEFVPQVLRHLRNLYIRLSPPSSQGIFEHRIPDSPVWHCGDRCACRERIARCFPVYMPSIDTLKIVDVMIIGGMLAANSEVCLVAHDLLQRIPFEVVEMCTPHIQNGEFALLRRVLFEASFCVKELAGEDFAVTCTVLEAFLYIVLHMSQRPELHLSTIAPLVRCSLSTVASLREEEAPTEHLVATLQSDIRQLFMAVSGPSQFLCIHTEYTPVVARSAEVQRGPRCANSGCFVAADLLKCSGCKVTWYCSIDCQRADWPSHRNFCRDVQKWLTAPPCESTTVTIVPPSPSWV